MVRIFDCSDSGCPGVIDVNEFFFPPVHGCTISHISYSCPICNLIHHPNGEPKSFTPGLRAFRVDGKIVQMA